MKRSLIILTIFSLVFAVPHLYAQQMEDKAGHSHEQAMMHDGTVVMTSQHHFEIVPMTHGLAVYAYDYNQNPIEVKDATGEAMVILKSGEKHSVKLKSHAMMEQASMEDESDDGTMMQDDAQMGMSDEQMHSDQAEMNNDHISDHSDEQMGHGEDMRNSMLWGEFNFSELEAKKAKVSVSISGLPSEKESSVMFRETLDLTKLQSMGEDIHSGAGESEHEDDHMHEIE
ncbi:MAG: hypothetical protein K9N46_11190 [Candidatus Marinimicrobia bacterium]|nr:hypothetical protein [Candidatus Neomarinimicrobiota bacterium]MCF7827653.1 hypothetical protein [Candidatus Neomarinimicrobiota bacterium]MCF7881292.1 hypothetical protein [Candidatus Neomarinimicrobiota bacterium]